MAHRVHEKAKRASPSRKEAAGKPADAMQRLETRAKAAEQERDALKGELEAARARIVALEESRAQVANRIDWVIDSLQVLVEPGD